VLVAGLTFLTPWGLLVGLVAVVPVLVLLLSSRRARTVAVQLGLAPAPRRFVVPALLAAGACVFTALAAAQPALQSSEHQRIRSHSEITYIVDVSRSMIASQGLSGTTRLARARSVVQRLHDAVPDVPSGLSGLTDRVLPYLFPTADAATFDETLRRSVIVESPRPAEVSTNATSFAALSELAQDGFFTAAADRRTCVLVSDGETRTYSTAAVGDALGGSSGCRLIVVRVGGSDDRVFKPDGSPEANFVPDPAADANMRALADAAGGRAFEAQDVGSAADALRADARIGPTRSAPSVPTTRALGPYAAAVAVLLVLALAGLRLGRQAFALIRT
jgi:hypothetical protein